MPTGLTFLSPDLHFCPSDLHISDHPTSNLFPPDVYISIHLASASLPIPPPHLSTYLPHLCGTPGFHISDLISIWPPHFYSLDLHISVPLTTSPPPIPGSTSLHTRPAPHLWHYFYPSDLHTPSHLTSIFQAHPSDLHWHFNPPDLNISIHLSDYVSQLPHFRSALPTCSKFLTMQPPLLADSIAHPTSATSLFSTQHPQLLTSISPHCPPDLRISGHQTTSHSQ